MLFLSMLCKCGNTEAGGHVASGNGGEPLLQPAYPEELELMAISYHRRAVEQMPTHFLQLIFVCSAGNWRRRRRM